MYPGVRLKDKKKKGVFAPTLLPVCNWFANRKTEIAERKVFLEVANQSLIEISSKLSFEHNQKTGRD